MATAPVSTPPASTAPVPTAPVSTFGPVTAGSRGTALHEPAAHGAGAFSQRLYDRLCPEECILDEAPPRKPRVLRQPPVNRLIHWLIALSTFSLFFSGFGQMPLYKRYMLSDVPGLAWTADYGATLYLHYLGAAILMFAVAFHLAYHGLLRRHFGLWPRRGDVRESAQIIKAMLTGGAEPPSAKYLAEQRLAYLAIGGGIVVLILTGLVKVAKNLPGVGFPEIVVAASTHLHNLAAVVLLLGIVGHLVALVIPANRKLVGGMFHGKVDRDYAEHRHPFWYQELLARAALSQPAPAAPRPVAVAPAAPPEDRSDLVGTAASTAPPERSPDRTPPRQDGDS